MTPKTATILVCLAALLPEPVSAAAIDRISTHLEQQLDRAISETKRLQAKHGIKVDPGKHLNSKNPTSTRAFSINGKVYVVPVGARGDDAEARIYEKEIKRLVALYEEQQKRDKDLVDLFDAAARGMDIPFRRA